MPLNSRIIYRPRVKCFFDSVTHDMGLLLVWFFAGPLRFDACRGFRILCVAASSLASVTVLRSIKLCPFGRIPWMCCRDKGIRNAKLRVHSVIVLRFHGEETPCSLLSNYINLLLDRRLCHYVTCSLM